MIRMIKCFLMLVGILVTLFYGGMFLLSLINVVHKKKKYAKIKDNIIF